MRKLIYLLTAIGIISLSLSGCESEEEKRHKKIMNSPLPKDLHKKALEEVEKQGFPAGWND